MGQSPQYETKSHLGGYGATGISWKPMAYFYVHKSQLRHPLKTHILLHHHHFRVDRPSLPISEQVSHCLHVLPRSQNSAVGIATGYGSTFESQWDQECSFLHVIQICSGAYPASFEMVTGALPGGLSVRVVKSTTHLHLISLF
jgi:hypothetical protein